MAALKHFVGALLLASLVILSDAKKCPADETVSLNDPNNLYDCPKDATCCFENGQPSCCTPKDMNESVKDQMKLWGGLAAVLVVIVIVVLTCRRDIEVCKEGTTCCPCCCKPPKPEDDDDQAAIVPVSQQRGRNMGPPDFTAPGAHGKPGGPRPVADTGGNFYPPAPVPPPPPPPGPPHQGGPVAAVPQEPPKTAGFNAIMDMADDDDYKF